MASPTREGTFLILGAVTALVLLGLLVYQAIVPEYTLADRTLVIIAGLLWAFLQIDILGGVSGIAQSANQSSSPDNRRQSESDSGSGSGGERETNRRTNTPSPNADSDTDSDESRRNGS